MSESGLPKITELGSDLLQTSRWEKFQPLVMPYLWSLGFLVSWHLGVKWFSFLCLVLVFSACSTSTHDVVHGSLGLNRKWTERLLFLLGAPILESGHAYRLTHLEHHRIFPDHQDLEGEAAHMPVWKVILIGPTFLPRLWLWAWRKSKSRPVQRRWLILEASLPVIGLAISFSVLPFSTAPLAYVITVGIASWFYPLFAVHLPHQHFEESKVSQAWTLRGRLIPRLFRPLAYHLEHHLYPMVPSHNLHKLAMRLEPFLVDKGVRLLHVP